MTSPDELAIDSCRLTKSYGEHRGVVDLDLEVGRGEVFGFLGPNGAGKSTTIHLLVGLLRPTAGTATVLGLDCWRDRDLLARHIGFLPGEFGLDGRLTGAQALDHVARLRRGVDPDARASLVERFGAQLDRPIRELSMGNRQKLGLVQALMHEPELIVLDEPTLGLDPLVQREFQALVCELRDDGRTVFLSSHRLSEVERVADRVGIIRDGELVEVVDVVDLASRAVRRIELELGAPPEPGRFDGLDGVRDVDVVGNHVSVEVEGPVTQLMKVAADFEILDLRVREADLEDLFLASYRTPEPPA